MLYIRAVSAGEVWRCLACKLEFWTAGTYRETAHRIHVEHDCFRGCFL